MVSVGMPRPLNAKKGTKYKYHPYDQSSSTSPHVTFIFKYKPRGAYPLLPKLETSSSHGCVSVVYLERLGIIPVLVSQPMPALEYAYAVGPGGRPIVKVEEQGLQLSLHVSQLRF